MREGNVIYVTTFIEGRDPLDLLVHELTHAITGIRNDAQGKHPPEFTVEEGKLVYRSFSSRFAIEPKMLGLEPKSLTEGQKVKVDIASFGLKKPSKPDILEARAMGRIKKRGTRLKAGIDPAELADYAIIGAAKIVKGTAKFADWSKEMTKAYGKRIKPHLVAIYKQAQELSRKPVDHWTATDYRGEEKPAVAMTPFDEKAPQKPSVAQTATWWARAKKHLGQYVEAPEPLQVRAADKPASTELIDKLAQEIKTAKPARRKTEALRHKERQRRAGQVADILKRGEGETAMKRAMGPLAGEYPLVGFEPIGGRFSAIERDALHDHIRTHSLLEGKSFTKASFGNTLRAVLDHGKLPTQGELSLFYDLFGPKVTRALMSKFGTGARAWRRFNDVANAIRASVASYDLSATLRQGWHLVTAHPLKGTRAFADQVRAFMDEGHAQRVDRRIHSGPQVALRKRAGLFLSDISGKPLPELKEEFYGTDVWHRMAQAKIKGKGLIPTTLRTLQYTGVAGLGSPKMIRASERAFSTMLNRLRADVFDAVAEEYRRIGLDPKNDRDFHHFKTLADFINSATGRGTPLIKKDWANTLFFSQRFLTSRWQHPYRLVKALKGPAPLRREAIRELVTSAGIWLGIAAMIKLAAEKADYDADVELDPRSSDFLKIRAGNARIDMGAGYGQVVRLIAHLMTGEYKELRTGKIKRADAQKKLGQYFRYKLAPVPSAAWSIVQRKTPDWKEPTPQKIAWELISPINVQTLFEVTDEQGARGTWLLIPETLGLGASIYEREKRP